MTEAVLIIINAALINNFVLVKFLGLCPLMGTSRRLDSALGMAGATLIVLTTASAISYPLNRFVLAPNQLEFLQTLSFILVIAMVVQLIKTLIRRADPLLHNRLGIYLPLITTNCAVLGIALLNARAASGFGEAVLTGLGASLGFALVLVAFAGMREKLEYSAIPALLRGAPIALITAGIMSLAFAGFGGLA